MDQIEELLTRGVDKIYPTREELEKVLRGGKKLRLYNGIDPTGELHIGHLVILQKMRQFQDLGHEVIILIGDFTATIGDPTGKKSTRKQLTREEVLKNARDYKLHIGKILDLNKSNIRFLHNEKWTNKLQPIDLLKIASNFTVAGLLERDMFQERIKNGKEIYIHEFLYPILQAYDSLIMDVDLEVGGSDQTFNMLAGRELMYKMKKKNKFVMTTPLLTDARGVKIGKTEGNVIALTDKPENLFRKIMALPDDVILKGFEYLTDIPMTEINNIKNQLDQGENPVVFKKKLAFEIVKQLNNEKQALNAQKSFEQTVQHQQLPNDIPVFQYNGPEEETIVDLLVQTKLAQSRSDAKRLIGQGGVSIDNNIVSDDNMKILVENGQVIKVGKRKFVKIRL